MCRLTELGQQDPQFRFACLPACEWQIEDTWHAAGLKGTGSHHVTLRDKAVPSVNFIDPQGEPCVPGSLYKAVPHLIPLIYGAVAVGIAEGAMDDLLAVAGNGRQQQQSTVPMRQSETFQYELGRVIADLRAARAFLGAQTASHWRHAVCGTLRDEALLVQGTLAGIWVTTACVGVADACFALAGGNAVFDSSPLQRRLRDLHVAAQHATVHQRHYVAGGRIATEQLRDRLDDVQRFIA